MEARTCRVIVNQAHCFATGGFFNNGLPFSLSMGCGSWGGNSIDGNLNWEHFVNKVVVRATIEERRPDLDEIFADYWDAHGNDDQYCRDNWMPTPCRSRRHLDHLADHRATVTWAEAASPRKDRLPAWTTLVWSRAFGRVAAPNSIWATLCFTGVAYGGYLATPLNLVAGARVLSYVLDHSEAAVVLCADECRPIDRDALGG